MKRLACAVLGLLLCAGASGCLTVADDDGPILAIELYWDEEPESEGIERGTCRSAGVDEMEWALALRLDAKPAECSDDRDGDRAPNDDDDAEDDPCVPDADAEACESGDSDDDGEPNGIDIDNDLPCDKSQIVASRREDCANAIDVLEPERGEYSLAITGRDKDGNALWNRECTKLTVLRFDIAYECDIEGP